MCTAFFLRLPCRSPRYKLHQTGKPSASTHQPHACLMLQARAGGPGGWWVLRKHTRGGCSCCGRCLARGWVTTGHCRCWQHQRQLSAPSRPTAERRPARSAGGHAWGQVHPRWGHCRLGAGPRWWVLPRRRPPKQTASWAVPARRVPQSAGHTGREQHAEGRLKLMLALSCQEKCLQRPGREATVNSRRRQEGNASQRRQNCADPPRLPVGWHAPRLGWHPSSGLPTGSREGQQR